MTRALWVRRLVSAAVAAGLAVSVLAGVTSAKAGLLCPREHHSCGNAMLSEACCPAAPGQPPASTLAANAWSLTVKVQYWTVDWLAAVSSADGMAHPATPAVKVFFDTGPPASPASTISTPLLI